MKKRKGIAVLLILILSLAVTACGDRYGVKEGESYIYCMNTDKTGLVKVAAKISGNSAIKKAESVIDEMKKPTNEIEYTQAIPEQVKLLDCALKGSILEINFSEEYYEVKSCGQQLCSHCFRLMELMQYLSVWKGNRSKIMREMMLA